MIQLKVKGEVLDVEPFVREAARALGYVREDCVEWLAAEIARCFNEGHIDYCIRRAGTELSKEEKKALGLRTNTRFSREVASCLTEKGLQDPLRNFETTCLRIMHGLFHAANKRIYQRMANHKYPIITGLEFREGHISPCKRAQQLNGKIFPIGEQSDLPLTGCDSEVCYCTYLMVSKRKLG